MRQSTVQFFDKLALTRGNDLLFLTFVFALVIFELTLIAFVYDPFMINGTDPLWRKVQSSLRLAAPAVIFAFTALIVMLAPERQTLLTLRRAHIDETLRHRALAANIILFLILLGATKAFNYIGAAMAEPPWTLFIIWTLAVFGLYGLLALAIAAPAFWRKAILQYRWHGLVAIGAGALVQTAALMSRQSWNTLSDATFSLSAFFLRLVERDIVVDADRRILGPTDFKVNIDAACSGYEGIGLVLVFLSIYLWIFRRELRFPNAWILLPLGVLAIWVLNGARIAILILIGAHFSEEVAITGFHSQAGWMMFLLLTIAIMLATHQLSFFRKTAKTQRAPSVNYTIAITLLAPFLAMTAAGIVAAAFTAESHWLYSLRVIAVSAALVCFYQAYRRLNWRTGYEPILLGLLVGAGWIATDPGAGAETALGLWLTSLPPAAAAIWLTLRLFGTIILVPMAEELAFRGYIHRKLAGKDLEKTAEAAFSWTALIVSSVLFAALHERWFAGGLAGVVFAIALYRSGKIGGAIIAHMAANALIALWAVAFKQWSLL